MHHTRSRWHTARWPWPDLGSKQRVSSEFSSILIHWWAGASYKSAMNSRFNSIQDEKKDTCRPNLFLLKSRIGSWLAHPSSHFYQPDAIDENTCTVGTKSAIILLLLTVDVMYVDLDLHVDLYVYMCDCPSSMNGRKRRIFL